MGTIAPTYNEGLNSLNLHDFVTLMILPIGTSWTNEIYKWIHYEVTNTSTGIVYLHMDIRHYNYHAQ